MNKFFSVFFAFGATMCALTIVLLVLPGTSLDSLWLLNPNAHSALQSFGKMSVLIMFVVGASCAFAAVGMWRGSWWGMSLALVILSVNILGDLFNAFVRHDPRTLIGLPIGVAMMVLIIRIRKKPVISS